MKANELSCRDVMVGDWVDVRNNAAPNTPHLERITPSHFLRDEHWYGVELVPEILEKNGFVIESKYCYGNHLRYCLLVDDGLWIDISGENFFEGKLEYVHQLQHALSLCGIEKEIVL